MPLEEKVREFMHPLHQYASIRETESVRRALQLMGDAQEGDKQPLLIVVGDNPLNKVIQGFITPSDVVFGIADHFLRGAERIGPIFWKGQFKSECLEAFEKKAADIMSPVENCISGGENIMEAIFLLNRQQVKFLPVVESDEVIGIIHLEDIFTEINSIA